MTTRSAKPGLLALLLAAGLLALLLAAPPALAGEYQEFLDRGLTNDEAASYVLSERARARPLEERAPLLEEAVRRSPDVPAFYFELSAAVLSDDLAALAKSADYALRGLMAYGRNFWWSMSLAGLLYVSLICSLGLALLVALLLRLPSELPLLSHEAAENRRMLLLPALAVPLSLGGPVFFVAAGLAVVGLFMRRADKALIYAVALILALSPLWLRASDMLFSAPSPEMRAVAAVNGGTGNGYALRVLRGREDFPSAFSYALALKREGRIIEAIAIYKGLAETHPDPRVFTNLGNAYFAVGLADEAKEAYARAGQMRPSVKTFFNMSQVYRDSLDFKAGDKYFMEAARMDRDMVSRAASLATRNPNRFVLDETLPVAELWKYAYDNRRRGASPFTVAPALASALAVALMAIFYLFDSGRLAGRGGRRKASRCSRCGKIVCPGCTPAARWGEMCPECFKSLVRLVDVDPRDKVARLLAVHERRSRKRSAIKALSFAPPGLAQVYAGRLLGGVLYLWLFLFMLMALVLNPMFSTGLAGRGHSWLAPVLALGMAVLYSASHLSVSRRLKKGWL
ncbi:MAG: hypothetical protein Kow0025_23550 [Thermodesulfovibrionales bacterium]